MILRLKHVLKNLSPNSSRFYLDRFARLAAQSLPPRARVLDAGAGQCPYRGYFAEMEYESADFCQVEKTYAPVDYVCSLDSIPVSDSCYDLVLMTQVLEHIPEPTLVLKEMHRILKPGGMLWISAPLFFQEHEQPHDYYRYTQFAYTFLLERAGFSIESTEWLEGYYGTLAYQLRMASAAIPLSPTAYGGGAIGMLAGTLPALLLKPLFFLTSILYARLDLRHRHTASGMCKNYAVVATKNG